MAPSVPERPAEARAGLQVVSIDGVIADEASMLLMEAIQEIAEQDADFESRMLENRVSFIVDSAPGTVTVPTEDAMRIQGVVRKRNKDRVASLRAREDPSAEDRNRAKVGFVRGLGEAGR